MPKRFPQHTRAELELLYEIALSSLIIAAMEKVDATDVVALQKQVHAWREAAMTMHAKVTARGLLRPESGWVQ